MANATNYLEEKLLDHILRNVSFTSPTTVYIGLVNDTAFDADLEAGDLTNEITGYTGDRKAVTFDPISQSADNGFTSNDTNIDFEYMPATTVKYLIITDSPTKGSGNVLIWSPAQNIRTTNQDDMYRIPANGLEVNLG